MSDLSPDPRQFVLDIERPHEQLLQNFVPGENRELLHALTSARTGFRGFWIFGPAGSGRSHLLRGSGLAAARDASYVGCADYGNDWQSLGTALRHAADFGRVVAIDDVGASLGAHEELLMQIYQRMLADDGLLLVAHTHPAATLNFNLADLASRMAGLEHYQIQGLNDADKAELLKQRAQNRGYTLSDAVLDYWLARGPRDLGALLTDLDTLDKASLTHQRLVTIPLLKEALGY